MTRAAEKTTFGQSRNPGKKRRPKPKLFYVSHYQVTRHYGGPEEGGWWYDRYKFIGRMYGPGPLESAQSVARACNTRAQIQRLQPTRGYQGRFSVANNTDHIYICEHKIGERHNLDDPKPHYE